MAKGCAVHEPHVPACRSCQIADLQAALKQAQEGRDKYAGDAAILQNLNRQAGIDLRDLKAERDGAIKRGKSLYALYQQMRMECLRAVDVAQQAIKKGKAGKRDAEAQRALAERLKTSLIEMTHSATALNEEIRAIAVANCEAPIALHARMRVLDNRNAYLNDRCAKALTPALAQEEATDG